LWFNSEAGLTKDSPQDKPRGTSYRTRPDYSYVIYVYVPMCIGLFLL